MSLLRICPKCRRKSLEADPATGRVWCLYAGTCGYAAMPSQATKEPQP